MAGSSQFKALFNALTDRNLFPGTITTTRFHAITADVRKAIQSTGVKVGKRGNIQLVARKNPATGNYTVKSHYDSTFDTGCEIHFKKMKETVLKGASRDEAVDFMMAFENTAAEAITAMTDARGTSDFGKRALQELLDRNTDDHISILVEKMAQIGQGPLAKSSGADRTMAARLLSMKRKNTQGA